jgi:hypothetical protein
MASDAPDLQRVRVARTRMEKLAWLLDGSLRVPGTRLRFGLDSIIGLIPGVGDVAGLLLGGAILYESLRVGAPRELITRMLGNSAADAIGGLIPGVGDLFDFAFKSNARNVRLLMAHLDEVEQRAAPATRGTSLLSVLMVVAFLALAIAGVVWVWHAWLSG